MELSFKVNGRDLKISVRDDQTLLSILRENLNLTGAKPGCEVGDCGACTVILNGKRTNSCLIKATQLAGSEVTTIEGLSEADGEPGTLQQAFIDHGATQCGYCTPGMILASEVLLQNQPAPSRSEIREALKGNLCRCTGYLQIFEAVDAAAKARNSGEGGIHG